MADREWNDGQPIYRQLRDLVAAMILDGGLMEGEPLPSVRQVAAEYRINPITAMQAYQRLVDERVVEAKRGRGMFVNAGARQVLLHRERTRFLTEQWPRTLATIHRLGLAAQTLLDGKAMEITGPECTAEAGGPTHPQPATDR
ncbi:MAG TPA: GntR family transcriptional regulator [Longimicrobium sp.]|jgi:GntR family transcriptional regulator